MTCRRCSALCLPTLGLLRWLGSFGFLSVLMAPFAPPMAQSAAPMSTPADIAQWPERSFDGDTAYTLVAYDGGEALEAVADGTASARYLELDIDLDATPYLEWSWRVDGLPTGEASERSKVGDDYAARIYVVREGLFGKLSARALNYVWSRREPIGASWPNAYTDRAMMRVVDSGADGLGTWRTHRRDLRADWLAAFGEPLDAVHGIAIMTDTDNTGSDARALYGAIRLLPPER